MRINKLRRRYGTALIFFLLAIIILAMVGKSYFEDRFNDTQSYLELLIPALDEYKSEHGVYPNSLAQVNVETSLPDEKPWLVYHPDLVNCQHESLLEGEEEILLTELDRNYRSNGLVYEICFHAQDSFDTTGTVRVYFSENREWGTRVSYGRWDIGQGIRLD